MRRPHWIAAAGTLLVLAALWLWLGRDAPRAVAPRPPAAVQAPVAHVTDARGDAAGINTSGDIAVDGTLETTVDGHLLPNEALRDVLTYFLLRSAGGNTDAALTTYLSKRLPPPAVIDALRLADSYRVYMKAHDELLAAQNLQLQGGSVTTSALARLVTWREQRARLRQRILGDQVALAWYQDDDMLLMQTIDELQRSSELPGAAPANGIPIRPVPRWTNKADQDRHERYLLDVIAKAATGFDALKRAAK